VDFAEKFSAALGSLSGVMACFLGLCFTVEGDSCALVLPPCILPSSSLGIGGLESGSNMRGSWGGR
jgi:hypothetical protein